MRLELKHKTIYHFYVRNDEIKKTFHYKAKFINSVGRLTQILDLEKNDYIIFPTEKINNVYPCEVEADEQY